VNTLQVVPEASCISSFGLQVSSTQLAGGESVFGEEIKNILVERGSISGNWHRL
jgi:hypothetical protein